MQFCSICPPPQVDFIWETLVSGSNFAPQRTCIFMGKVETKFLEGEFLKPWNW